MSSLIICLFAEALSLMRVCNDPETQSLFIAYLLLETCYEGGWGVTPNEQGFPWWSLKIILEDILQGIIFFVTYYCNYYGGGREEKTLKNGWSLSVRYWEEMAPSCVHAPLEFLFSSSLPFMWLYHCISNGVSIWLKVLVQTFLDISSVKRR